MAWASSLSQLAQAYFWKSAVGEPDGPGDGQMGPGMGKKTEKNAAQLNIRLWPGRPQPLTFQSGLAIYKNVLGDPDGVPIMPPGGIIFDQEA